MQQSSLSISYAAPKRSPLDLLMIEQQEWGASVGAVTRAELARMLKATLYGGQYENRTDCGVVDGSLACILYVYPRVLGLAYRFFTSHGRLGGCYSVLATEEELLNFRLTTRERPKYPPRRIVSASWMDDCYDANGATIPRPALAIEGEEIVSAEPVYGAVKVVYQTERHRYLLTCPRREGAVDNLFSAVVYGVYQGGLSWREIEMPPGIEAFEADANAECGWGGTASLLDPEDNQGPIEDSPHNRTTKVSYCTQKILRDEID